MSWKIDIVVSQVAVDVLSVLLQLQLTTCTTSFAVPFGHFLPSCRHFSSHGSCFGIYSPQVKQFRHPHCHRCGKTTPISTDNLDDDEKIHDA